MVRIFREWRCRTIKQLKPRDKITQKMTRDGVVEVNETQQTAERISSREADSDFSQPDSAAAERVIEHLDAAHTRKANKKAVKKEQEATALRTSTSRLQFTDEERATLELERYIENQTKPLTDWTRQRQLSRSKRNWLRSAPLMKPQEKQRPAYALKNRKNRYPAAKRETRCPAPHRKRGFSSITRYIRLKRTIPALRGRINRRNLPSAARNTGRGS